MKTVALCLMLLIAGLLIGDCAPTRPRNPIEDFLDRFQQPDQCPSHDIVKYDWIFASGDHGFRAVPCERPEREDGPRRFEGSVWQYGQLGPAFLPAGRVPGAMKCWATILDGNYPDRAGAGLLSPEFLVTVQCYRLKLYHSFRTQLGRDGLNVTVNNEIIEPIGGYPGLISGPPDQYAACVNAEPGFSGEERERVDCFDLSEFIGQRIRVRFDFGSDSEGTDKGCYIWRVMLVGDEVIHTVNAIGSGDFPTIQAAIDAIQPGEIIELAGMVYTGEGNRNISFRGKGITVRPRPNNIVTISCGNEGFGFEFTSGEGPESVLQGIRIENGFSPGDGGGILCRNSSPTIVGCLVAGCSAQNGGAILVQGGSPVIQECEIRANEAAEKGGGIWLEDSGDCTIKNCSIVHNQAGGAGGGIWANDSPSILIENCTIAHNQGSGDGGGFHLGGASSLNLSSTIVAFNSGHSIFCDGCENIPKLACCDLYGNSGGDWVDAIADQQGVDGNFHADPLFCSDGIKVEHYSPCQYSPAACHRVGALNKDCLGASPYFESGEVGLKQDEGGSGAWGDYDGDGDLDLLVTGQYQSMTAGVLYVTRIYRNSGGLFEDVGVEMPEIKDCSSAWGDFDNDGDLDLLLGGTRITRDPQDPDEYSETPLLKIYEYDSQDATFRDTDIYMVGLVNGSATWVDVDNDGDLDIFQFGHVIDAASIACAYIFRNDGGKFSQIDTGIKGRRFYAMDWGDSDRDGDLDLLLSGDYGGVGKVQLFDNTEGHFTLETPQVIEGSFTQVRWCDSDNDGTMDLFAGGPTGSGLYAYREGQSAEKIHQLLGLDSRGADLGDFDNDGDCDIVFASAAAYFNHPSAAFRNDLGGFSQQWIFGNKADNYESVRWGDYDNDCDIDLLLTRGGEQATTTVFKSKVRVANQAPLSPANLSAEFDGTNIILRWDAGSDPETPAPGLTYNVRVGASPGGSEIVSAMSYAATGRRFLPEQGNARHNLFFRLDSSLIDYVPVLYWTVQAVDAAYAGSPFAAEAALAWPAQFADVAAEVPGLIEGSAAWGDYDGDGDLDLLLIGQHADETPEIGLYKNEQGNFNPVDTEIPGVYSGTVAWGDYENDGDLDILITGFTGPGRKLTRIYRNTDEGFIELNPETDGLDDLCYSSAAWGDYDNDGDLDILATGWIASWYERTYIYGQQDDGSFTTDYPSFPGIHKGSAQWGDFDRDGGLDFLFAGVQGLNSQLVADVYRRTPYSFNILHALTSESAISSIDWGDCDNDGDLDIVLAGKAGGESVVKIYAYDSVDGHFALATSLDGFQNATVAWGDYDNDGDRDILHAGDREDGASSAPSSRIYTNNGGAFSNDQHTKAGLKGVANGVAVWGDYDGDGDLDLFLSGETETGQLAAFIYRNQIETVNQRPSAPTGLAAQLEETRLTLSWSAATDDKTDGDGLTYNLRVGTTPGGSDILSAMADPTTGVRMVAQDGNAYHNLSWTLDLSGQTGVETVYWSVQALDTAYTGSEFAPEQAVEVNLP